MRISAVFGSPVTWRRGETRMCEWADMTESVTVTWAPGGPAAPQPQV